MCSNTAARTSPASVFKAVAQRTPGIQFCCTSPMRPWIVRTLCRSNSPRPTIPAMNSDSTPMSLLRIESAPNCLMEAPGTRPAPR